MKISFFAGWGNSGAQVTPVAKYKLTISFFNFELFNKDVLSLRKRIIRIIKSTIRKKSRRRVEYT
jgi:hypothetical protein